MKFFIFVEQIGKVLNFIRLQFRFPYSSPKFTSFLGIGISGFERANAAFWEERSVWSSGVCFIGQALGNGTRVLQGLFKINGARGLRFDDIDVTVVVVIVVGCQSIYGGGRFK